MPEISLTIVGRLTIVMLRFLKVYVSFLSLIIPIHPLNVNANDLKPPRFETTVIFDGLRDNMALRYSGVWIQFLRDGETYIFYARMDAGLQFSLC